MLWSGKRNAGFSGGEPWLPLSANWRAINAARQARDPRSILNHYRALLRLRRGHPALQRGAYRTLAATDKVLVYERTCEDQRLIIALNFSAAGQSLDLPAGEILLDSALRQGDAPGRLRGHQAIVLRARR
jgi:glycosidase